MTYDLRHTAFILLLFLMSNSMILAQKPISDLTLIKNNQTINTSAYPKRAFMLDKTSKPIVKYNPIAYVAGGTMYFYQNAVSPQFSAGCLYHPSCSDFSKQLINKYGLFKGVSCTTDRLTRCNRVSALSIRTFELDGSIHKVSESTNYYTW